MDTTPRSAFRPPAVPDAERVAIVARIKAARERAGLSPESLSAAAGLSAAAVRQIESGRSSPTLGTLYAIAGPLGLHPADLLRGTTGNPKK